jgi:hypothetical protein
MLPLVPNLFFRERLAWGSVGVCGINDPASPDNALIPADTPGIVDLHSAHAELRDKGGTYRLPQPAGRSKSLSETDYTEAARKLGSEVAVVKAVAEVESGGDGFFDDGRPKILFEAHQFSRLTSHAYDKSHPDLSSPTWDRSLYKGGKAEYERLEAAIALDAEAALKSASWGKFQIMGFNHEACGFAGVTDYVSAMYISEGQQLMAFLSYCQANDLSRHLANRQWADFARKYNGPKYKENKYDEKLQRAYEKHSGGKAVAMLSASVGSGGKNYPKDVELVQRLLTKAGQDPGKIDRSCGPKTIAAIKAFQKGFMPKPDGLVQPGKTTIRKLSGVDRPDAR